MEPKQRALQVIDQNAEQIADVGDSIWSFAEIGMQEYETHDLLAKVLSQEGFRIDPIVGFPTAVMAIAPRVSLMLEGNPVTEQALRDAGCRVHTYKGDEITLKSEGGPTCLTRPILRRD